VRAEFGIPLTAVGAGQLNDIQEVRGSTPLGSTNEIKVLGCVIRQEMSAVSP
jgi:hypothetical protein